MDSILNTIKKMLGIDLSFTTFDTDIIVHINSIISVLTQLGVGPDEGYHITDENDNWSDFINDERYDLSSIKTYIYLRVRLLFDPPTNSFLVDSINNTISELEWRINISAELNDE